ncbi:hypothetical protein OPV22_019696 [Ensete ventricosum]|uniref:Uncharacterized protein n=1 Tax=Ensete ventricosum TaxID=4639 RepID=A0AAV8Q897_ENSVE|nr:hypothetical protein OPV22_019696 [Ensete ventricosum]
MQQLFCHHLQEGPSSTASILLHKLPESDVRINTEAFDLSLIQGGSGRCPSLIFSSATATAEQRNNELQACHRATPSHRALKSLPSSTIRFLVDMLEA